MRHDGAVTSIGTDRAGRPVLPTFVVGRGRPVVYLPGLGLTHELPTGPSRLGEVAPLVPLLGRLRVHWLGRREDVPAGFTIADFAQDTAEFLIARATGPVPVIGFSTGGFVALQLALDHPELVERLVVIGAGPALSASGAASERVWLDHLEAGQSADAWRQVGVDLAGAGLPGRLLGALLATLGPGLDPRSQADALATARADLAFDITDRIDQLGVPTLFVLGRRDSSVDPAAVAAASARIPAGSLQLLAGTGHLGSCVHPAAAHRIARFLTDRQG